MIICLLGPPNCKGCSLPQKGREVWLGDIWKWGSTQRTRGLDWQIGGCHNSPLSLGTWEVMGTCRAWRGGYFPMDLEICECFNNHYVHHMNISLTTTEEPIMCLQECFGRGWDTSQDLDLSIMIGQSSRAFWNIGRNSNVHRFSIAQQDPSEASIWPIWEEWKVRSEERKPLSVMLSCGGTNHFQTS